MFKVIKNFIYKISGQKDRDELQAQVAEFNRQLEKCKKDLEWELEVFKEILGKAYSDDPDKAFEGSIELARHCGVPEDRIIHNDDELEQFFMN